MIELDNITKTYHQERPGEVRALRGISHVIDEENVTVFRGASGSGKTTLLTLIGGLARPTSGRIRLAGELISNLPEKFLAELRRKHFGFIFQRFNLVRGLDVMENIMLPAYPLAPPYGELRQRAHDLLARLSLADKAAARVDELSGGQAQRVAIARALINDPEIIIADEPTANLDTRLAGEFLTIMAELRAEGRTIIMTSHDPRIWDAELVDQVVTLEDGRITDIAPGPHAEAAKTAEAGEDGAGA